MYFVLAAVGLFTLLVGASVRLRRPRDQATLHFFWLCVAFFGVFTFSFNGPFDRLDWVFYWGDAVALALLPPLLLHFTLVFPERPSGASGGRHAALQPLMDVPALLLVAARVSRWRARRAAALRALSRACSNCSIAASRSTSWSARSRRRRPDPRLPGEIKTVTGSPSAPVDRVGHGVRRRSVCVRLRPALGVRRRSAACAAADRRSARARAAHIRVRDRPLPPPGCRGDHQARPRLHLVLRRQPGAVCRAAPADRLRVSD